jgi:hypothetical protein
MALSRLQCFEDALTSNVRDLVSHGHLLVMERNSNFYSAAVLDGFAYIDGGEFSYVNGGDIVYQYCMRHVVFWQP